MRSPLHVVGVVFLGMLAGVALVSFCLWVSGGFKQIKRVQQSRTDFAINCVRQKGHTIRLNKSNVSMMCVGPDGRILGSY